jgi:hypothetical protein
VPELLIVRLKRRFDRTGETIEQLSILGNTIGVD